MGTMIHLSGLFFFSVIFFYDRYKKSNSPFKWIFICTFLSIFIHKSVILFITKLSNIQFFIVKATIYSSSPSFSSSLYHPNILIKFIIISISLLLLHKVYKKTTDSIYQKLYLVFVYSSQSFLYFSMFLSLLIAYYLIYQFYYHYFFLDHCMYLKIKPRHMFQFF